MAPSSDQPDAGVPTPQPAKSPALPPAPPPAPEVVSAVEDDPLMQSYYPAVPAWLSSLPSPTAEEAGKRARPPGGFNPNLLEQLKLGAQAAANEQAAAAAARADHHSYRATADHHVTADHHSYRADGCYRSDRGAHSASQCVHTSPLAPPRCSRLLSLPLAVPTPLPPTSQSLSSCASIAAPACPCRSPTRCMARLSPSAVHPPSRTRTRHHTPDRAPRPPMLHRRPRRVGARRRPRASTACHFAATHNLFRVKAAPPPHSSTQHANPPTATTSARAPTEGPLHSSALALLLAERRLRRNCRGRRRRARRRRVVRRRGSARRQLVRCGRALRRGGRREAGRRLRGVCAAVRRWATRGGDAWRLASLMLTQASRRHSSSWE